MHDLPILLVLLCRFKGGKLCSRFHEEEDEGGGGDDGGGAPSERGFSSLRDLGRDMVFSVCSVFPCERRF